MLSSLRGDGVIALIPPSARRLLVRGRRPRTTLGPLLVEALEGRMLLSMGPGGGGSSADPTPLGDPTLAGIKSQVVDLRVSDLLADGIAVPAQLTGTPDATVQALRFDNYLLIGGQFYQYASGQGYPLVPVAGPSLQGNVGVQHGPIPVLLPQQEPAFSAIPDPVAVAVAPASPETPAVPVPAAVSAPVV